jgi:hypothetical protein
MPTANDLIIAAMLLGFPLLGVNVGCGRHVEVPPNWAALSDAGQDVPGVTRLKGPDAGDYSLIPDDAAMQLDGQLHDRVAAAVGQDAIDAFKAKIADTVRRGVATCGPNAWDSLAAYQIAMNYQGVNLDHYINYTTLPSVGATTPPGVQFVPFIPRIDWVGNPTGTVTQANINNAVASATADSDGNKYLLVGGEPDLIGASPAFGETLQEWIDAWEFIANDPGVIASGIKLVSPSMALFDAADGTSNWFRAWWDAVTRKPDVIAVHPYATPTDAVAALGAMIRHIDAYRNAYPGYPLWATEYGMGSNSSDAEAIKFEQLVSQSLLTVPRLLRYSYFFLGPEGYTGALTNPNSALHNSDGSPRPLGVAFRELPK